MVFKVETTKTDFLTAPKTLNDDIFEAVSSIDMKFEQRFRGGLA